MMMPEMMMKPAILSQTRWRFLRLSFFLAARFGLGSLVVGLVYVYSIVYFGFADSFLHCYTFAVLFNKRTYTRAGVDTMIQITNVFLS